MYKSILLKSACLSVLAACSLIAVATVNASENLQNFDGKPSGIEQYAGKGKWLVVMLWASDCGVCNKEVHQYTAFHKKHSEKDAIILGVSLDGAEKKSDAEAFLSRHKVNFPSLIGEPEVVAGLYQDLTGAQWVGTPTFLVYTPKGELVGAQVGAVPPSTIETFIENESQAESN
ncbi:MAG: TlpA family protein disulfide reductase [Gammaproteobacteria bacterium]|jgi:peroxiredoxin|nr:TlpA family protein disulfide reductase [Gammaproteobacteria bacterium]